MVREMEMKMMMTKMVWDLVWICPDAQETVIRSIEQTQVEYEVDGRGDALASLLPPEMIDAANSGEWAEEGLVFTHEGQQYLVRCRALAWEEEIEPLSLGCGVMIDLYRDWIPRWYIGVYTNNGDWIGEVMRDHDPLNDTAIAGTITEYILRVYPRDRLPVGPDELERRIRMVFETVREGAPRSYPEIERKGGI